MEGLKGERADKRLSSKRVEKMIEMRKAGKTYREIADVFGISRQAVHCCIKEAKERHLRHDQECEKIVFQGIYDFFKADPKMNYTKFTILIYGHKEKRVADIRNFITGAHESRFPLIIHQRICEICGTSFEDTFKRREGR